MELLERLGLVLVVTQPISKQPGEMATTPLDCCSETSLLPAICHTLDTRDRLRASRLS